MSKFNPYVLQFTTTKEASKLMTVQQRRKTSLPAKEEPTLQNDYLESLDYEEGFMQNRAILSADFSWSWKNALDIFLIILASLGFVGLLIALTSL
jgi:hypothetical protein